MEGTTSEMK